MPMRPKNMLPSALPAFPPRPRRLMKIRTEMPSRIQQNASVPIGVYSSLRLAPEVLLPADDEALVCFLLTEERELVPALFAEDFFLPDLFFLLSAIEVLSDKSKLTDDSKHACRKAVIRKVLHLFILDQLQHGADRKITYHSSGDHARQIGSHKGSCDSLRGDI